MVHYQKQRKQGKNLTDIVICDIKTYSLKIYIYFPSILKLKMSLQKQVAWWFLLLLLLGKRKE